MHGDRSLKVKHPGLGGLPSSELGSWRTSPGELPGAAAPAIFHEILRPSENLGPGRSQGPCPPALRGPGACLQPCSFSDPLPRQPRGPRTHPVMPIARPVWPGGAAQRKAGDGPPPGRRGSLPSRPADLAVGAQLNGRLCEVRERRAWREQRLELQGFRPSPWASPARRGLEEPASPWVPGLDFLLLWVLGQGCASPSLLPAVNLSPL